MRTPPKTADNPIIVISVEDEIPLRIETVHSVKGCSFDAVLFLSTQNGHGRGGYWENWLANGEETMRIGYVASTRPKYLLCWGVPPLSDEQRTKIENVGFISSANVVVT